MTEKVRLSSLSIALPMCQEKSRVRIEFGRVLLVLPAPESSTVIKSYQIPKDLPVNCASRRNKQIAVN